MVLFEQWHLKFDCNNIRRIIHIRLSHKICMNSGKKLSTQMGLDYQEGKTFNITCL